MINKYYTKDYYNLFKSLKRYIQYVLNYTLEPLETNNASDLNKSILFILENEKESLDILRLLSEKQNSKIVLLGFDADSRVNLIDLPNLNNNFLSIINNPELLSTTLFSEDEIKDKLKNFFKGHGEESLLDGLNWSRYYFLNGPLLLMNKQITEGEYSQIFLKNGINYWDHVKTKFYQYEYHLALSGLEEETKEIESLIEKFDNFVETVVKDLVIMLNELNEDKLYKNIDLLRNIDNILSNIADQFGLADAPIQFANNR